MYSCRYPFWVPFPSAFPMLLVVHVVSHASPMLLVVVSTFGCIQTAGSAVVPNSKRMLPKKRGQLSPSPGRGPYAPDGVIRLTTEAMTEVYRVAFGQRA